jgi:metabolite-proton symporter
MQDAILEPPGSHEPSEHAKTPRKAAASGWIGSALEYYDFFIYAQAAAFVFPQLFFPSDNPQVGIVASFATFGVGYVARPVGAFVLGHWGDRHGRKSVLVLCMLLMGVSTFLVALLPTYAAIGIWAPILLVTLRLIQGFAVGGEISGASAMILEHSPFGRRGYYASYTLQGVQAGQILAAAVFLPLAAVLPEDAFQSWGWRIPFLLSTVLVLTGLYIRLKIEDSPAFRALKDNRQEERFPAGVVFRRAWKGVIRGALTVAAANIPFYMATVFALTYGADDGIGKNTVLGAVCIASLLQMATIPYAGILCDRFGRRPVLLVGAAATIVMAFPFFWLIDTHNTWAIILALVVALPICHTLTYAPQASFLPEIFPTQLRYSGAGIAYTSGGLLFSAPVPFVSAALFGHFEAAWPLSLYIILGGVLTFFAVAISRETVHDDIDWVARPADQIGHAERDAVETDRRLAELSTQRVTS